MKWACWGALGPRVETVQPLGIPGEHWGSLATPGYPLGTPKGDPSEPFGTSGDPKETPGEPLGGPPWLHPALG